MTDSVLDILQSVGAVLLNDHFVYTSGKHGSIYINKDALYPHTQQTSAVGQLFAERCQHMTLDTVAAPALGGIILSQWVAFHLSRIQGKEIAAVYAEKMPDKTFAFTRSYDRYIAGKRVLVIEDLTTTGQSVKALVEVVRAAGGEVAAVGVMVNRNPDQVNADLMGAPFFALGVLHAEAFEEADMPDALRARPINTAVGHGAKYLRAKGTQI